ncbi:hypothetical protein JCM10295v2_004454 [Rhodotorula toruloides]
MSLPNCVDLPPVKRWVHQDRDTLRPGFRCIQDFVNLNPSGGNDGGLTALKGGHLIISNESQRGVQKRRARVPLDERGHGFELAEKGLERLKDDSRLPHCQVVPTGDVARFVVYVAFAPVSTATEEDLVQKNWLFENTEGHLH